MSDHSPEANYSPLQHLFEAWIQDQGHHRAADVCPWADGQYFGATNGDSLIDEFLDSLRPEIEAHVVDTGPWANLEGTEQ